MTPRLRGLPGLVLGALCAHGAFAGVVTLTIKDQSGAPAADAVVVFDALDATVPPTHDTAIIDQIDKQFMPRVSVIRTGTSVTFPNSDRIRHQVYSFSPAKTFSLKLYAGSPRADVVFDKPGLVVLGCNIHDSMVAFVGVVATPYFAKIPSSGSARLTLPVGRYRMRVWHPYLSVAVAPRQVDVGAGPSSMLLSVDIDPGSASGAAWPE